ncbi:MAG: recombinase family protein [SAR324 cluster bacterium]|nr:recombinase family protein [SAR324 cluster bacterium]
MAGKVPAPLYSPKRKAMTARNPVIALATHEVTNQPPPLEDYNLFDHDAPLKEALRREGAAWAEEQAHALGIDLYLHQQGIDTTTPAGKAMFHVCGVFVEFERSIIRERINAGLARARSNGKRLGRRTVGSEVEEAIQEALRKGDKGIRKIAGEMGVGVSVVQRVKMECSPGGHRLPCLPHYHMVPQP